MKIELYYNTSPNNQLNKSSFLENGIRIEGFCRASVSLLSPILTVDISKLTNFNIFNYNYCYIEEFNRYYFITNIVIERTNLYSLYLSVDPLFTYKDEILNCKCNVIRTDYDFGDKYNDDKFPLYQTYSYEITNIKELEYFSLNKGCAFILAVSGTVGVFLPEFIPGQKSDNTLPPQPIFNPISYGYRYYIIDNTEELKYILNEIFTKSEVASFIGSLYMIPFDISILPQSSEMTLGFIKNSRIYLTENLAIENLSHTWFISGNINSYIFEDISFTIIPKYNNFLKYEPYSIYEVFLPYAGYFKIPTDLIKSGSFNITYCIDFTDGNIRISLKHSVCGLIYTKELKIGSPLPLNSSNLSDVERNNIINGLQLGSNLVTGVLFKGIDIAASYGSAMAAAGASSSVGGMLSGMMSAEGNMNSGITNIASNIVNSITNYATNAILNVERGKTDIVGSNYLKYITDMNISYRITYIDIPDKIYINEFYNIFGQGCNISLNKVSDLCYGFTILNKIILDNINCTSTEKMAIESIFNAGVIV